jgi:threonine dehydrogenase-like Zn-dependent dehydrogenase
MRALTWHGTEDVRVENVPDPRILHERDAIIKVTSCAICGSDLHLYDGFMPGMEKGDILGHETMGEVVEVGPGNQKLKVGDRVVVPFNIACGECYFCKKGLWSLCDRSNPGADLARKMMGHAPAGLFGYSHLTGGYPGGQAEYLRVPYADVGPIVVPDGLDDEHVLFLSDILPTGYMAAENAEIEPGDTVAVWGCGPVGQMCIQSAWLLGAGRVIAIDNVPERLELAGTKGKAEVINSDEQEVGDALFTMTGGRGPDRCIDAVGTEAHAHGSIDAVADNVKKTLMLGTDRAHVIREAIICCRKGGTISMPGVYVGFVDKVPLGAFMNKGLTLKSGQTHTHRYLAPLLELIRDGRIDPSFVITHRAALEDGPALYRKFRDKEDHCIKVVMFPHGKVQ